MNGGRFAVRPATVADLPAIAAIQVTAAHEAWRHIAAPGALEEMQPEPGEWAPRLERADHAAVAVDVGGEAVGFAISRANELEYFFTHPRVWGAGAGRALLADAEAALRDAGHAEAVLWTEERNHRPLRIYRAAGWYPDGAVQERAWAGTTIRELRLRKRLGPAGG